MKAKPVFRTLLLLALCVVVIPAACASTWYVDGRHGNDNNQCKSRKRACRTIGHAISLASSGDTILAAPAIYLENLTIPFALKVIGARASTTIVDGQFKNIVFTIPKGVGPVTLSGLTIRKGVSGWGGGIYTAGILEIDDSIITENLAASIDYGAGGGILIDMGGKLTLNRSTVNSNYATGNGGGSTHIWKAR
jgi:hypothetical protein